MSKRQPYSRNDCVVFPACRLNHFEMARVPANKHSGWDSVPRRNATFPAPGSLEFKIGQMNELGGGCGSTARSDFRKRQARNECVGRMRPDRRRSVCGAVHFRIERKAGIRRFCGYRPSMTDLQQLCSLPVAERLELVEDLWDSIAEEPGELRLTASHLAELDRRIDRFEESPEQGSDWNTLKGGIPTRNSCRT